MTDVTRILSKIGQGDASAAEHLLPLVYDELRSLARVRMAGEAPNQTLDATALVHEAYIRLVDVSKAQHWNSRGHFFAAAAEAMRRILVEKARRKQGPKKGGGWKRVNADVDRLEEPAASEQVLAIDEALCKLALDQPLIAKLVELKFFAGLTLEEAAALLDVSPRTARRYWAYAKIWLHQEIHGEVSD